MCRSFAFVQENYIIRGQHMARYHCFKRTTTPPTTFACLKCRISGCEYQRGMQFVQQKPKCNPLRAAPSASHTHGCSPMTELPEPARLAATPTPPPSFKEQPRKLLNFFRPYFVFVVFFVYLLCVVSAQSCVLLSQLRNLSALQRWRCRTMTMPI